MGYRRETPPDFYKLPTTNWSLLGSVITLLCGILAVAGVFLPWVSGSVEIFGVHFSADVSGWEVLDFAGIEEAPQVLLVIAGGGLMALFCLPATLLALTTRGRVGFVRTLLFFSIIAALLAIGGAVWYIAESLIDEIIDFVGFGVYVSGGAALFGLIFGVAAYLKTQFRVVNFREGR